MEEVEPRLLAVGRRPGHLVPPAETLRGFAFEQQDAQLGVEPVLVGQAVEPARERLVALRGVVQHEQCRALPGEAAGRVCSDHLVQISGRDEARDPGVLAGFGAATVDGAAEFQGEAGLAGPGAADQGVDGDVRLGIEPGAEFRDQVLAPDQGQLAGIRDEDVEVAWLLAVLGGSAATLGRAAPWTPQRQDDAAVAEGERHAVAVAGNDDALANIPGRDRSVVHERPHAAPVRNRSKNDGRE